MNILEQGLITTPYDLMKLNIIDWNRLNGFWANSGDALLKIANKFINQAHYTIIEHDLSHAPRRDDWPGWDHVGQHVPIARLYWNDFHYHNVGELRFSDEPDFSGIIKSEEYEKPFWGDIGRVSASAFSLAQMKMKQGSLWISLLDDKHQVIIEPTYDISSQWVEKLGFRKQIKI